MPANMPRFDSTTALLIVDVQKAIDDPKFASRNNPQAETQIASLLKAWRTLRWPVIHIRHDSTNPSSPYRPGQAGNEFKPVTAPLPDETVVPKRTNSAFVGTELQERLAKLHVDTLVICGVLTHNCVEATARHAGNLGLRVFVVGDACWAVDKEDLRGRLWPAEDVHQLSLANINGEYGTVTTVQAVLEGVLTIRDREKLPR